jgi:SulP family sulfate permease
VSNILPILSWLPKYDRSWLKADLVAGATIWAVLVPLAMACAVLVGVEPVYGLYTLPMALFGYAVFGGSRLMAVAPDTAVCVLVGGVVTAFAVKGAEPAAIVLTLAILAGVIFLIFSFFKMGWIADLVPEPVLKGFVEGVVWLTIMKQMVGLLGLDIGKLSSSFHQGLPQVLQALPTAPALTAAVGIISVAILLFFRHYIPKVPGSLVVLVGIILLVHVFALDKQGLAVLGAIDGGLPDFSRLLAIDPSQSVYLLPGALAIVVLGYTKSLAALKLAASQGYGERIDPNRELFALGISNLGTGLSTGYAVAGSLTGTTVGISTGAKSQIANIVAAVLSILTVLFLLPLLANLAMSSLAAIIVVALLGLSDLRYFRNLWRISRFEFLICVAAFLGVLTFGVMPGVMIGVVLSLFKLAYTVHSPSTAVVGKTPAGAFVDMDEHPDALEVSGILIWRQYGPLAFLNARVLSEELRAVVAKRDDIKLVIFDATTSAGVDTTAADALIEVKQELEESGIDFWLVNPRQAGWKMAVATLEAAKLDIPQVFDSLAEAVNAFQSQSGDG